MRDLDLRASDDERRATAERLAAHFRAGRLSADELEERIAAANAARTRGDLVALEADLPDDPGAGLAPAAAPAPAELDRARGRRERLVSLVAVSAFLWLIWAVTDFGGFAWPIFPTTAMVLAYVLDFWGGRGDAEGRKDDEGPARR